MNNISLDIIKLFEILKFNVSNITIVSSFWKNNGDVIHTDSVKSQNGHLIVGNDKDIINSGQHILTYPKTSECDDDMDYFLTATDGDVILENKNKTLMTISPNNEEICFGDGKNKDFCLNASKIRKIKSLSNQIGVANEPLTVPKLGIKKSLTGENAKINRKYGDSTTPDNATLYSNTINLTRGSGPNCYQQVRKHYSSAYAESNTTNAGPQIGKQCIFPFKYS